MEISVIDSDEVVLERPAAPDTRCQRFRKLFRRRCWFPRKSQIIHALTKLLVFLFFCGSVYGILQNNTLPGTEIFALVLLAVASYLGGKIIGCIRLPPLLGMIISGFLFRNLSFIPYYQNISHKTISIFRDVALVFILLSAGLGLDGKKLRKMKMVVFRLTVIPCIVETASVAVFTHFLIQLPWIWAIMLGLIISAVSPAVVLPILLNLTKRKLGTNKGIPTLIIAASSMDDILAIAGFTVTMSIAFSDGNLKMILIKAPLEPLVGCAFGAVFGVILWYLPHRDKSKPILIYYHTLLLYLGGLSAMFLSKQAGIPGSGALGCISLAFVASLRWRKDEEQFEGITCVTDILWEIIQPFMFALIGAEVTVSSLQERIGYGVLALILGLCCRSIFTAFITFGANLNIKEKIFVCCAWLPKATVQAAVGSQAFDYARLHNKGATLEEYGKEILDISVLSIIITAPLGAALTAVLGPVLLSKEENSPAGSETCVIEEAAATNIKSVLSDYGSCHQLQPSDILPSKTERVI